MIAGWYSSTRLTVGIWMAWARKKPAGAPAISAPRTMNTRAQIRRFGRGGLMFSSGTFGFGSGTVVRLLQPRRVLPLAAEARRTAPDASPAPKLAGSAVPAGGHTLPQQLIHGR